MDTDGSFIYFAVTSQNVPGADAGVRIILLAAGGGDVKLTANATNFWQGNSTWYIETPDKTFNHEAFNPRPTQPLD